MKPPMTGLAFAAVVFVVTAVVNVVFAYWLSRRFAWLRSARGRRVLLVGLAAIVLVEPLVRLVRVLLDVHVLLWIEAVVTLWDLSLLVALPVIVALEAAVRLVPGQRAAAPCATSAPGGPTAAPPGSLAPTRRDALAPSRRDALAPSRRDALAKIGGTAAVAAAIVPHAWGFARTRFDVDVVEVPIRLPRLPRALDGFTIVQVSDVHVGIFLGEPHLRRLEDVVRGLRPDLVAMTGDLVHLRREDLPLSCEWVARLGGSARFGSAAILGNHEYYVGRAACIDAYRRAKVDLLVNDTKGIAPAESGGFLLTGVDDAHGKGRGHGPRFDAIPSDDERARILLCHQPSLYREAVDRRVDLMLSGHTHGGQIAPLGPIVARAMLGPTAGLYRFGDTSLYVNRGLGTSGPPSRVAVRPEITKIVLLAG